VTDTRTWSRVGGSAAGGSYLGADGDEQQYLVGGDQADNEDDEDGNGNRNGKARSRSQSLNGGRGDELGRGLLGVMGNADARLSRLDVHSSNDDTNGEDELQDNVSRGGLSAKAGIILVCHFILELDHIIKQRSTIRASTTFSSLYLS
jgi:hypothetical protein